MWLDKELMFSEAQDISQTAGTYVSTNVIDLGGANKGEGEPIEVLAQIIEALTSAGSATLQIKLDTDDNAGFSSAKNLYDSGALAKGTFIAGYQALIRVLPNACERYLRMSYIVAVATTTAGKITSGLVRHLPTNK